MKKVLVIGYFARNLGDDLLFKALVSRYPNSQFDLFCYDYQYSDHYKSIYKGYNVHILSVNKIQRFIYKVYRKIFNKRFSCPLCKVNIESYNAVVYIGGSIFQEGGHILDSIRECSFKTDNIFVIGSSFGPYKSDGFLSDSRKTLSLIRDVCFRDHVSYNLFANQINTRVSSDVVFSLPMVKVQKNNKSLGVSVINIQWRTDVSRNSSRYLALLDNLCKEAIDNGYAINLYSFCEEEGDSEICHYLKEKLLQTHEDACISIIAYKNNLNDFVNSFCSNRYTIATRFHAVVLSIANGIPVLPISYMNKTDNLLSDINYTGVHVSLHDMNDISNVTFSMLESQTHNPETLPANSQFLKLDEILN